MSRLYTFAFFLSILFMGALLTFAIQAHRDLKKSRAMVRILELKVDSLYHIQKAYENLEQSYRTTFARFQESRHRLGSLRVSVHASNEEIKSELLQIMELIDDTDSLAEPGQPVFITPDSTLRF